MTPVRTSAPTHADALRRAGLRPTRQRIAVLDALTRRDGLVTAQELHHALRSRGRAPALATVYRTLAALASSGHLDTFGRDGEQAFRLCRTGHHHHLVCDSCGSVEEVRADEVEAWVTRTARRRRFAVRTHTAEIYGICSTCA